VMTVTHSILLPQNKRNYGNAKSCLKASASAPSTTEGNFSTIQKATPSRARNHLSRIE